MICLKYIHLLLACFIVLWLNSGVFDYVSNRIPVLVRYLIVAIWFVIAALSNQTFVSQYVKMSWLILLFIIIVFVSNLFGISSYYNSYFMTYIYIAIIQALFVYYYYNGNRNDVHVLVSVFFLDILFVSIRTYIELQTTPIVVRALSTGVDSREFLLDYGQINAVGGYAFCYQLAFIIPCISYYFKERLSYTWIKWILYAGILLLLFECQITIALIISVIFIGIEIILRRTNGNMSYVYKLFVLLGLLVVLINIKNVIELVKPLANDELASRLTELQLIFSSDQTAASDFSVRLRLYLISFNTFWDNPLWGTFGNGGYGAHSSFIDVLASYGLLGIFAIMGILRPIFMTSLSMINGSNKVIIKSIFIIFVLFSTINVSLLSEILLLLSFIIPLVLKENVPKIVEFRCIIPMIKTCS